VKVRVKNKHLIIAVVVFLACTGLVYASGPFYLFDRAEWARNHQDYVTALAHYDALIAKYPDHELVPKALRQTFERFTFATGRGSAPRPQTSRRSIGPSVRAA